jgi:hypothetical protein
METLEKLKSLVESKGKNSYDEVGELLGYKGETIFQWVRTKKIPSRKLEKEISSKLSVL